MTRTSLPTYNYAGGQVDDTLTGRSDIGIYHNSSLLQKNFYSTIEGTLLYRQCLKYADESDNLSGANNRMALYDFEFNEEQCYQLGFDNTHIYFWVVSSDNVVSQVGAPLTVAHPYGDDRFDLKITQKGDVMYICNSGYAPRKLTRTAADEFSLATFSRTADPFTGADDYPAWCVFYENSLYYGRTNNDPTTIWKSKAGDYDNMTEGNGDDAGLKEEVAEVSSPLLWGYAGKNSLVIGCVDGIVIVNGGGVGVPVTPATITLKLANNEGSSIAQPVEKDGYIVYISKNKRQLFAFKYDTLSESFEAKLLNKASQQITQGGMTKIVYKKDKNDFLYILGSDKILVFLFSAEEGTPSLCRFETREGDSFLDIETITRPDGNSALFVHTLRSINGADKYFIENLADYEEYAKLDNFYTGNELEDKNAFIRYTNEVLKNNTFLDCNSYYSGEQTSVLTYVGSETVGEIGVITSDSAVFSVGDVDKHIEYKTATGREYGLFAITEYVSTTEVKAKVLTAPSDLSYSGGWYLSTSTLTGLTHLIGEEVSIVGNGAYLGEFTVNADGEIDISKSAISSVGYAVVGFKYRGEQKSFNFGLTVQGVSTMGVNKNLYKIVLKILNSLAGKAGDSLYNMIDIKMLNTIGLYNNMSPLITGSVPVDFPFSELTEDKSLYIVQDEPSHLQIAMAIPYTKQYNNT